MHPMLNSREKEIDELIEKTKQQGYSAFLNLFHTGFQYASNLVLTSALKGQSLLGHQLKKSLSMNDVYVQQQQQNQQQNVNNYMEHRSRPDTINEMPQDDDSDFEQPAEPPVTVRSAKSLAANNAQSQPRKQSINARDYEIIDNDEDGVWSVQANSNNAVGKRRAASRANLNSATAAYKSNEVNLFRVFMHKIEPSS